MIGGGVLTATLITTSLVYPLPAMLMSDKKRFKEVKCDLMKRDVITITCDVIMMTRDVIMMTRDVIMMTQ
jgi:hypothetical protein